MLTDWGTAMLFPSNMEIPPNTLSLLAAKMTLNQFRPVNYPVAFDVPTQSFGLAEDGTLSGPSMNGASFSSQR